ncbi:MAG: glutathione S-transferase family protein [Kiloniellales bacterium]|nr:glutathione S-transferase family protein [Kiloniellales bacterium]
MPLILVGQFDSPFVRRVAVALNHYGLPYERNVLSVFRDFEAMLAVNPLGKVPSLILERIMFGRNQFVVPTKHVNPLYILELEQIHAIEWIASGESIQSRSALEDGARLYESRAIIEYLEGVVPAARRLTPEDPALRAEMLRVEAIAIGLAEKFYERGIEFSRKEPESRDAAWIARLERQIESALGWLEARAGPPWLVGDRLTRADLALTVAATFGHEKQPQLIDPERFPRVAAHCRRCEALPVFTAAAYSADEAAASGWRPEDQGAAP